MKIDLHKTFGTRECPSCASEVEANHNRCPICKYEFPTPPSSAHRTKAIVAVILLLLIFGGLIRSFLR